MTDAPNTRKDPAPMDRAMAVMDDTLYRAERLLRGMTELLRKPEADDDDNAHE